MKRSNVRNSFSRECRSVRKSKVHHFKRLIAQGRYQIASTTIAAALLGLEETQTELSERRKVASFR